MRTDKMRDVFEAWMHTFDLPPQLSGAVFDDEAYMHSPLFGQFVYDDLSTQRCWAAWQASRAALVIELPTTITAEDAAEAADLEDERAVTVAHMVNGAIAACGAFIKAAGVGVK